MVPALSALADTPAAPAQRFGFIYVPHGSIMPQWTPAQEGSNFEFSAILTPLEDFRQHLTVLSDLSNNGENGHSVSSAMWLSGTVSSKGSLLKLGTTWTRSSRRGSERIRRFRRWSLRPRITRVISAAALETSYARIRARSVGPRPRSRCRWRSIRVSSSSACSAVIARARGARARLERNRSILDAVAESARELNVRLGPRDRARVAEYMDNVREIGAHRFGREAAA